MILKVILSSLCSVFLFFSLGSISIAASLDFEVIPMHYGLLNGKYHSFSDLEGLNGFNVLYDVSQGEQKIIFNAKHRFHLNELIAYRSAAGKYHVAQIANKTDNSITLTKPLAKGIVKGVNVWNFYSDGSHPNHAGFMAVADFAIAQSKRDDLDNKIHAFIGDSWFDEGTFEQRIKSEISVLHSINKAVGGRTSQDTLNAFDVDFPLGSLKPNIFWISLSTNDYWGGVTAPNFISNIEKIIVKVNAMGAKAIILDASVGPLGHDDVKNETTYIQKDLSDAYADQLKTFYEKHHPTTTVTTPTVPSTPSSSGSGGGAFFYELFFFLSIFSLKVFRFSAKR